MGGRRGKWGTAIIFSTTTKTIKVTISLKDKKNTTESLGMDEL